MFSLSETAKVAITSEVISGDEYRVSLNEIYSALLSLYSNSEYIMVPSTDAENILRGICDSDY